MDGRDGGGRRVGDHHAAGAGAAEPRRPEGDDLLLQPGDGADLHGVRRGRRHGAGPRRSEGTDRLDPQPAGHRTGAGDLAHRQQRAGGPAAGLRRRPAGPAPHRAPDRARAAAARHRQDRHPRPAAGGDRHPGAVRRAARARHLARRDRPPGRDPESGPPGRQHRPRRDLEAAPRAGAAAPRDRIRGVAARLRRARPARHLGRRREGRAARPRFRGPHRLRRPSRGQPAAQPRERIGQPRIGPHPARMARRAARPGGRPE